MFDRHQAEITVMQCTGHSHPVHQSMSVPWDFYLVPFFQPSPPTRFLLLTAIGMCHFLPVHHFGMACLAGSKVNIYCYVHNVLVDASFDLLHVFLVQVRSLYGTSNRTIYLIPGVGVDLSISVNHNRVYELNYCKYFFLLSGLNQQPSDDFT